MTIPLKRISRLRFVGIVASCALRPVVAPFRLFIERAVRKPTQIADKRAIRPDERRRDAGARRLVHEWHELVREARHRAADANAADIGATTDAADPTAFWHVALYDRAPASDLHEAFARAIFGREVGML